MSQPVQMTSSMALQALTSVLLLCLLLSYQTVTYFAVLIIAMVWCYSQPVHAARKALSAACVFVTWFYIIRFMANYEGPMNAFDAAYADVIWGGKDGNWFLTQPLLTWAVVATVWSAEHPVFFTVFGVFGAMSGSYALFLPKAKPDTTVPAAYAIGSLTALLCVAMLPLTSSAEALSWWLWGLHVSLIVPKICPAKMLVDRAALYVVLAVLCVFMHFSAPVGPWPNTDCRISISVDTLVCSGLTIAFFLQASECPKSACFFGALVPVVSPGAALAAFCACQQGCWPRLVLFIQRRTAQTLRERSRASDADARWEKGSWMNLGYWKETSHYDTACQQLAAVVGSTAQLSAGDRVLAVACGYGDELRFFKQRFDVKHVTGLEANEEAAKQFGANTDTMRFVRGDVSDMARGRHFFRHDEFNKIVAVDSIYHADRERFLQDCAGLLPAGGVVAVTDVVLSPNAPWWVKEFLSFAGVPKKNHWTQAAYTQRLESAGFQVGKFESLEPHVLRQWFPKSITQHLDYVVVSAELKSTKPRPTAAVVGSGLSGLVAAHLLRKTHDVTIFEARPHPGFAGWEARLPSGQVVDIPLRMIEPHYWSRLVNFCQELDVPMVSTNFTVSLYGSVGVDYLKTEGSLYQSFLRNFGYYFRIATSAVKLGFASPRPGESLREFVDRMGLVDSDFYRIYVRRHLSWVLSCTYAMVDKYPAEIILNFFRSIQGNYFQDKNPTLRIDPSVKALENALLAGKCIKTGCKVAAFGETRSVDGKEFDAVVIASEANAVAKILPRPWTSIFDEFQYHPSHIFVHRDPSLMPENRDDWRAVNVCDDVEGVACQISVWVNAYYGCEGLGGDIFETVNPRHRPKDELIVREVHLQRVVHTSKSAELQRAIAEMQGKEGYYFCGAYSVSGMGLLEQACHSAHLAAEAVWRDMGDK